MICSAAMALAVPAQAAFVSGSLSTTSGFTETATSLLFCKSSAIPCPNTPTGTFYIADSGSGDFSAPYANDPSGVTVTNLNSTNAPVGTLLTGDGIVFLTFNPSAALLTPDPALDYGSLAGGWRLSELRMPAADGQECTPAGSAVTFLNSGGASSATITANGLAERISTGQFDALKLVFTAQFTTPFQTMLANFAKAGSLSSTESGPLQPQRFPNLPRFSRLPALQELMMETAVRAGKYEVAFEQIKLLLTAQPNSAGLHAKLGDLYRMTGDRANAIAQLEQAGKLAPNHPDVNLMLANLLADTGGNLSEGIKDAQRALLKDPENPQIKDTIGWLYARMNYTDAALSILANLTKRYPDSPTYRYHLGYAMLQKGERQQARNELTIALSSGPAKEEDSAIRKLLASASR